MADYKTKYAIGDLVYIASADSFDREVIKAIKIVGLKSDIHYGFERARHTFFFYSDTYDWYKSSEIFEDKESALAMHESLKAKREAERIKEENAEKAERKARLLEELKELEG